MMSIKLARRALFALAMILLTTESEAQMKLPFVIGNGMVIQRDAEVPIWGWADAGTEVHVMFRDQTYTDTANSDGMWRVELPPMNAGGPFEMAIVVNDEMTRIGDILIGDVWICSGQSNMEWVVRDANDAETEIASADDPMIRHFKVPRSWSWEPEHQLAGGEWQAASPETVGDFTAVGYFFARELREHVGVPIGLINTSWGGSRIEPWMNPVSLRLDAADLDSIRAEFENWEQSIMDDLAERLGPLPTKDQGYVDGNPAWADPDLDTSDWDMIPVPGVWEQSGYQGLDGVGWYRTEFDLSDDEAARDLVLGLAMIDDSDVTWVNGVKVGSMDNAYTVPRRYVVPAETLRAGRNVIAIRVHDTGGGGGVHGDPSLLFLEDIDGGNRRSLVGEWNFKVGAASVNLEGFKNKVPTVLYNKMIYPLLDYPIAGAIWYQGESNAGPEDAFEYRSQFQTMIEQWRGEWGVGDFPFLFVQLANYMEPRDEPVESSWALLRESQSEALVLPNTGEAVIIDIGETFDIHPRNKQDVGLRLSLAARKVKYGEDIIHSGPRLAAHEVRDGRVYLAFDHVGSGLVLRDLPDGVSGFAIAGPDREFVWAEARLEGDRVVVFSPEIADPVAVRYAWADNPVGANLYNQEGLPASPFRTDDW
jgi:sialate O-acetylesterase